MKTKWSPNNFCEHTVHYTDNSYVRDKVNEGGIAHVPTLKSASTRKGA